MLGIVAITNVLLYFATFSNILGFIFPSQFLFLFEEFLQVVLGIELYLVLEITEFTFDVSSSVFSQVSYLLPRKETSGPLLNHYCSLGLHGVLS